VSPKSAIQNQEIRAESKRKILDAAFKLIAKDGYESTSIAKIAKEAEVSKGLLYNYFNSKEDMVKVMLEEALDEGDVLISGLLSDDPKETIRNVFQWFFREIRERLDYWRLITQLTFNIEKFKFVQELAANKMGEYIRLMQSLLNQLGYENPLNEARIIAALFDGIGVEVLVLKEQYPLDEMEAYLIEKYCK